MINLDDLDFVQEFPVRRGDWHCVLYILKDKNEQEYICTVAKNSTQENLLLKECLCYAPIAEFYGKHININPLLQHGPLSKESRFRGSYYALFPYLKGARTMAQQSKDIRPFLWLKQSYQDNAIEQVVTPELVDEITLKFLVNSYGEAFARTILDIEPVLELKQAIAQLDTIKLGHEQGDFTPINMLQHEGLIYLIDFGGAALNQPIGHDMYLYYKKLKLNKVHQAEIPYYQIHDCKHRIRNYVTARNTTTAQKPKFSIKSNKLIITPEGDISFHLGKTIELDLSEHNLEPGEFVQIILLLQKSYKRDIIIKNAKDYYYGLNNIDCKQLLFSGRVNYPRFILLKTIISWMIPLKLWRRKFRDCYIRNKD